MSEHYDVIEQAPRDLPFRRVRVTRKTAALSSAAAVLVLALVAALIVMNLPGPTPPNPADALVAQVTAVPVRATDDTALMTMAMVWQVDGPRATAGGKPEVLYFGAEADPFSAAQAWAVLVALGRFGTFTGVTAIRSAKFDGISPIDTWSLYGSSYHSAYLAFVPVETRSGVLALPTAGSGKSGGYSAMRQLTSGQRAILARDNPNRGTPFLDFAGQTAMVGTTFPPDSLEGLTWGQITASLGKPGTGPGARIVAAADFLTTQLCAVTGNKPARACPPYIRG
jgi:hypothetical protein